MYTFVPIGKGFNPYTLTWSINLHNVKLTTFLLIRSAVIASEVTRIVEPAIPSNTVAPYAIFAESLSSMNIQVQEPNPTIKPARKVPYKRGTV